MRTHTKTLSVAALVTLFLMGCASPPLPDACDNKLSPAIANSCVVKEGTLWRGSKPDSIGAAALVSLGVKTVVNLELVHEDVDAFATAKMPGGSPGDISYFRIRDWEPDAEIAPKLLDSHVAEFIAVTKTQATPIYVHCRSGQNRTGVMVAAYRILVENASIESAVSEMQRYRGFWFEADASYVRTLTGKHRSELEASVESRMRDVRPTALLHCSAGGCNARWPLLQ